MQPEAYRQVQCEQALTPLITQADCAYAVLASPDGLPLATVGAEQADLTIAIAAILKAQAERVIENIDEIFIRDNQEQVIVCRFFTLQNDILILAFSLPFGKPYRRLSNQAIQQIRRIWTTPPGTS